MREPKIAQQLNVLQLYAERMSQQSTPVKGLLVFGPPGIGKSHVVREVLQNNFLPAGNPSEAALFDILRKNPTGTILMDDSDVIWQDVDVMNLLKAALDGAAGIPVLRQNRQSIREGIDGFVFLGRLIVLSNEDPEQTSRRCRPHVEALMSRCHTVKLSRSPLDLLEYLDWIVAERDHFRSSQFYKDTRITSLGFEAAQDVLDFLHENAWLLDSVSVRALNQIAVERKIAPADWRERIEAQFRETPIRGDHPPPAPRLKRWRERQLSGRAISVAAPS
jgi:hypothetical protein